jgi:hypothetical protein
VATRTKSDHHKLLRLNAIKKWGRNGVLVERQPTPLEKEFLERVKENGSTFFHPIVLGQTSDFEFHRDVSYLIDAFDQLPARPDVAFDSIFKALESTIKRTHPANDLSLSLRYAAERSTTLQAVVRILLSDIPMQSCDFLYKRLNHNLTDWRNQPKAKKEKNQVLVRLREAKNDSIDSFVDALEARSNDKDTGDRRKQAAFIRKALSGQEITGSLHTNFILDEEAKAHAVLSGLLYTARNDRFHGESFSPFVSSTATLKTYVHPQFLILAAYSSMMALWQEEPIRKSLLIDEDTEVNLQKNLDLAKGIFGNNWNA